MKLRTARLLAAGLCLHGAIVCHAEEPSKPKVDEHNQRFLLTIDIVHTVTRDALQLDIIVKEGETFFVSLPVGEVRWTLSGDVGHVVHHHLPILFRARWFQNVQSHATPESPMLVKVNAGPTPRGGAINSLKFSLNVRETTEADQLPPSKVMQEALQQRIQELRAAEDAK